MDQIQVIKRIKNKSGKKDLVNQEVTIILIKN